jgi:uncharacterized protein YjbJ (UPF0337 family)
MLVRFYPIEKIERDCACAERRSAIMGEFIDKIKGNANQAAGKMKQGSADPAVRDEGRAQETKGEGQELKGKMKGVVNKL